MLHVKCPSCSKEYDVPEERLGHRLKCPCGQILEPQPRGGPPPEEESEDDGARVTRRTARRAAHDDVSKEPPQGVFSVFKAPGDGPLRALWVGLLLLVLTFGIKQVLVSWAMTNLGTAVEEPRLEVKRAAELAQLEASEADMEARERVYERYRKLRDENRGETAEASASALQKVQWFLYSKLALDLLRLLGSVLVLFGAFHVAVDARQAAWVKTYAVVCGSVALLTIVMGNLFTLLG